MAVRVRGFGVVVAVVALVFGLTQQSFAVVYFQVAEWPGFEFHNDSYILPLTNPADIDHARNLIALGPDLAGSPIAIASIAPGSDGINRDLNAPGEPLWSWHVTGFDGFADFTAEILDGWPTFVEQDVQGWIDNTNGFIGFWSYTVVAELPDIPEPGSAALVMTGAVLMIRRRPRGA